MEQANGDSTSFRHSTTNGDVILLQFEQLDEREALQYVRKAEAGATVLFVGTTRNEFKGKQVGHLEYSAYSTLARKTMEAILEKAHSKSSEMKAIYLAHRLGHVPIAEASILVCVSSAQRKEAFVICEEILEEVKKQVPIWKKEVYIGDNAGEAEWKANG